MPKRRTVLFNVMMAAIGDGSMWPVRAMKKSMPYAKIKNQGGADMNHSSYLSNLPCQIKSYQDILQP